MAGNDFDKLKTSLMISLSKSSIMWKCCCKDLFPDLSDEQIVELFKKMVWSCVLNERSTKLNQGRLGFFAPTAGEEASQIGSEFAMEKTISFQHTVMFHNWYTYGLPLYKAFLVTWSR